MTETVYIVLTKSGVDRMVKRKPDINASEYVVEVKISVPDAVFAKRPIPVVELTLAPQQLNVAEVVIDGQPATQPLTAEAQKTHVVQSQLAALFRAAQSSTDPNMQSEAKMTLSILLDSGVDVRIVSDEQSPKGSPIE